MSTFVTLLDLLCSLNEVYWLYRWVDMLFSKRVYLFQSKLLKKGLYPGLFLSYLSVVFILNRVALTSPYTIPILAIINIVFVLAFWESDIAQAVAVIGVYFLVIFVKGNIEISLVGFIGGGKLVQKTCFEMGVPRIVMLSVSGIGLFLLNRLLLFWGRENEFNKYDRKSIAVVSVLGLAGSAFMGKVFLDSFQITVGILWYMLLIIVLLLLYLMYFLMKSWEIRLRSHALEIQNNLLEQYYRQVDDAYKRKSKLFHEMNHHLHTIYSMLQDGETEKAIGYIESIGDMGDVSGKKVYTGIGLIDAIVNDYSARAEQKNIDLNVNAQMLPIDIGFASCDICSLFTNLLENAVEAATEKVAVHIGRAGRTLYLKIENDTSAVPVRKGKRFVSGKDERELHGWGTQIVEDIVERYEGDVEYNYRDGIFGVYILLNEK